MTHPLDFFIDFVEKDLINDFKDTFFDENLYINTPGTIINVQEEYIQVEEIVNTLTPSAIRTTFNDFLLSQLTSERIQSLKLLDIALMEMESTGKQIAYLKVVLTSVERLVKAIQNKPSFNKYKAITYVYSNLKSDLEGKMLLLQAPNNSETDKFEKILWTGELKDLAKLLYELANKKINGKPLLMTSKSNLERVMSAVFEYNGNEGITAISPHTPKKYLTRAKNEEYKKVAISLKPIS